MSIDIEKKLPALRRFAVAHYVAHGHNLSGAFRLEQVAEKLKGVGDAARLCQEALKRGLIVRRLCVAVAYQLPVKQRVQLIARRKLAAAWNTVAAVPVAQPPYGEVWLARQQLEAEIAAEEKRKAEAEKAAAAEEES